MTDNVQARQISGLLRCSLTLGAEVARNTHRDACGGDISKPAICFVGNFSQDERRDLSSSEPSSISSLKSPNSTPRLPFTNSTASKGA